MKTVLFSSVAFGAMALALPAVAADLTVWVIDGDSEKPYFEQLETTFNAQFGPATTIDVVPIPSYNETLQAASMSGDMPDVIMVDGPNMAAMAWSGLIKPIGGMFEDGVLDDLLPAVRDQGTYGPTGDFYFASPYDSGTVLWGNRKLLEEAGVRIPTAPDEAWSADELGEVLEKLAALDSVQWPLDMRLDEGVGEWMTYGFSTFVQSNGGDLIDRETWVAEGTVNSPANVAVLTRLQDWYNDGWIVPASAGGNTFFGDKTSALVWIGNWMWPAHQAGLGEDLVLIPPPAFGQNGPVSANGGWGWSVPASSSHDADVAKFLNYAMSAEQVALYGDITGYVPSRASAVALSERYGQGGEGALFAELSACCAIVRPVHPAYPTITSAWANAVANIFSGTADVQAELDRAAQQIDREIEDNAGFPPFGG